MHKAFAYIINNDWSAVGCRQVFLACDLGIDCACVLIPN